LEDHLNVLPDLLLVLLVHHLAVEHDLPRGRGFEGGHQPPKRGLAGPTLPDEGDDLARGNAKVDVVDSLDVGDLLLEQGL
jgi:hypothetical protein